MIMKQLCNYNMGSHGDVSGFQTIATCRDALKIPVTSRQQARLRRGNEEVGDVADNTTGMSRFCRGLVVVANVTGKSALWYLGYTRA